MKKSRKMKVERKRRRKKKCDFRKKARETIKTMMERIRERSGNVN